MGLLVLVGCDGTGETPDAGTGTDASSDAGHEVDSGTPTGECSPACGAGESCFGGRCVAVGPNQACGCEPGSAGAGEVCHPDYGIFADDETILFVDGAAAGGGDGTLAAPFSTIGEAVAALDASGGTIAIKAGTYTEDLTVTPRGSVRVHGSCARDVRIAGQIQVGSPPGPASFVLDGVTVAPAGFDADAMDEWGSCADSVEPRGIAISPGASSLTTEIRDSVIAGWCTGVYFNADPSSGATLCVHESRVSANDTGLDLEGGPAGIPGTGSCLPLGYGSVVQSSLIDQNRSFGVFADRGTEAVGMNANVVALTGWIGERSDPVLTEGIGVYFGNLRESFIAENVLAENLGGGLAAFNLVGPSDSTREIEIADNVLVGNGGAGIALRQLQAETPVTITGNEIRATGTPIGGDGGDGIQVTVEGGTSYAVTISGNTIADSARDGIMLDGVSGTVSSNTITGSGAVGLLLQGSTAVSSGNAISGSGLEDESSASLGHGPLQIPVPSP
ncbi:MAG: right-handed parallel beta-helix repeat-containing protein [Sandaracinaceae bacterium]|nr:right-handed parallel beta-helix repeat-containing protein [Sandaracinaceae bacterium]